MAYLFDPVDGFKNTVSFPNPATETAGRAQVQSLLDQAMVAINVVDASKATREELAGVILGIMPDGSIDDVKLSNVAGQVKGVVAGHVVDGVKHITDGERTSWNANASETVNGNVELATQSEVSTGASTSLVVTPNSLRGLSIATTVVSDNLRASSDSNSTTNQLVFQKKKAFSITTPGVYRTKFDLASSNASYWAYAKVYKNGAVIGASRMTQSLSYVNQSEDIVFAEGDTCELWIASSNAAGNSKVCNFRLSFDVNYNMTFSIDPQLPPVSFNIG